MKEFLELAKHRYSCRKYKDRPVEEGKIEQVLEAGRIAPSAVNLQPWHFFVARTKDALSKVHPCYHREWLETAPCVIVICGNPAKSWKRKGDGQDHLLMDVAITTDHMTLQATDLDLATCWICNFDPEALRQALNLHPDLQPIVLLPLGYPADPGDPGRHEGKRKPLSKLVTYL